MIIFANKAFSVLLFIFLLIGSQSFGIESYDKFKVNHDNRSYASEPYSVLSHQAVVDNDSCDVILMNNGEKIHCKIVEITKKEVSYRECVYGSSPIITVPRREVDEVHHNNGDIELMHPNYSSKIEKTSVLSILFGLSGLFFVPMIFGPFAILLGSIGVAKAYKNNSKGKITAIFGILLGLVEMSFAILLLVSA